MKTNFDYFDNIGKEVVITKNNGEVKQGILLILCPDDTVILDIESPSGITYICEIDRADIKEIVLS